MISVQTTTLGQTNGFLAAGTRCSRKDGVEICPKPPEHLNASCSWKNKYWFTGQSLAGSRCSWSSQRSHQKTGEMINNNHFIYLFWMINEAALWFYLCCRPSDQKGFNYWRWIMKLCCNFMGLNIRCKHICIPIFAGTSTDTIHYPGPDPNSNHPTPLTRPRFANMVPSGTQ